MAFLGNPTARFTHYVDPAGTSAGPGSATAPWATLDQGIAAVPTTVAAVGGATGVIVLNGTAASPNSYISTAGITVSGVLTLQAANTGGAKVAGNGTSQAILLATGANLSLTGLILDPSLNNGGAADIGIKIPSTASTLTLTLTGVTFQNWADAAVSAPAGCRLNYTQTNCTFNGGNVNSAVFINGISDGVISISGGSCTLTSQKLGFLGGALWIFASVTNTVTMTCSGFSTDVTIDPSLLTGSVHYGMRILNMNGATVTGGNHYVRSVSGSRQGCPIGFETTSTGTINNNTISNLFASNTTAGGYCVRLGAEASGVPTIGDGCVVTGVTVEAGSRAAIGDCHGIFTGTLSNASVTDSVMTDCGIGFVDKGSDNTTATGLTINGFYDAGIRSKGTNNCTYTDNAITQKAGYSSAKMLDATYDNVSGAYTLGLVFEGNTFTNSGTGTVLVRKTVNDTATASGNVYNTSAGTQDANPWQWGSANYATLAAWKAIEPTASGNVP